MIQLIYCKMPKLPAKIKRNYLPEPKAFDRPRDHQKFYNSWPWRKTSKAYRISHPLCECKECEQLNRVRPAEEVNHKRGLSFLLDNGLDPFNWDELESMSKACHTRFSGMQRHGTEKGYGVKS